MRSVRKITTWYAEYGDEYYRVIEDSYTGQITVEIWEPFKWLDIRGNVKCSEVIKAIKEQEKQHAAS